MISVSFSNLEEVKKKYSPDIIERATRDTAKRLSTAVAKNVSSAIRKRYKIKDYEIRDVLKARTRKTAGYESLLIYTSKRLSLPRFASGSGQPTRSNRPKIKTLRGIRYGAKVSVIKSRPPKIVKGAFWGRGRAGDVEGAGAWQIWSRNGPERKDIKRLTGPSISQLVGGKGPLQAMNETVRTKADQILAARINFYSGRKAGIL